MFKDSSNHISKAVLQPYWLLLLTPIIVGIVVRFIFPDSFTYSVWSDRDLLRALRVWNELITEGAEMNGAYYARVPGGFYYYILALFQLVSKQPVYIYLLLSSSVTAGFYIIYRTSHQVIGMVGAAAATGA